MSKRGRDEVEEVKAAGAGAGAGAAVPDVAPAVSPEPPSAAAAAATNGGESVMEVDGAQEEAEKEKEMKQETKQGAGGEKDAGAAEKRAKVDREGDGDGDAGRGGGDTVVAGGSPPPPLRPVAAKEGEEEADGAGAGAGAGVGAGAGAGAGASTPAPSKYVSRDELARDQERAGVLTFKVIYNDGEVQNLKWLINLKGIFASQLPKMPREYIARLVLDRRHRSMVIIKKGEKEGDEPEVVGGICFRPFYEQHFAEIVFLAITATEQVRGYGTRLMNHLKESVKVDKMDHFLTYADNYAVGYFKKQGFSKTVTMPVTRWGGYIKDYDGGTLMECRIYEEVNYLDIPGTIQAQRKALIDWLRERSKVHVVYDGLTFEESKDGSETIPLTLQQIPGVREAGWKGTESNSRQTQRDRKALQSKLTTLTAAIKAHAEAWPFLEPVDAECAPDYYTIIEDPMDLSTINSRVNSGHYATLEMYRADFNLMFANCREYNDADTQFVACAAKLESFLNTRIRNITNQ